MLATAVLAPAPARAERVSIPLPDGTSLQAELAMPSGPASGAGIVALHGCGGPFPSRDRQWARILTEAGHPVLFPDSFGSRGLGSQCGVRNRSVASGGVRRTDALAAAAWLAAQPFTQPGGVVLMGWSNGASTALAAARLAPDLPDGLLRGTVLFYPSCRAADSGGWLGTAPTLLLIGAADDWTPAEPCRRYAEARKPSVTFVAYPGAYHDFDAPNRPLRTRKAAFSANGTGMVHQGTDHAARADAIRRVPAFIATLPPLR